MSTSTTASSSTRTVTPSSFKNQPPSSPPSRIPVTPAALRGIFASSRTLFEERSISRAAFFRFSAFLVSCLAISVAAARGRVLKNSAALLGVV